MIDQKLLQLLARQDYSPLSADDLRRRLRIPDDQEAEFAEILKHLEQTGQVARIKGRRYIKPNEADLVSGRIRLTRQGRGFLQPDEPGLKEIEIAASATHTAMNEDRVLVRLEKRPSRKGAPAAPAATGVVIRILERRRTQIVGTLQQSTHFLYVIPDDPRMPQDIYVAPPRDVGRPARVGDKVVVEVREWTSRHNNPEGEIVEVLGLPDAEGVDMLSVIRQYNLQLRFPQPVLDEARAIGSEVRHGETAERLDCRSHNVITIDPDDAKDFDDAIYLERAGANWRLWVHVADVSHYVKPGTALDEEARQRGNSTYLVDRVIPMLPEALSNELCSLKPQVDRLTKCVEFIVSDDGQVLKSSFHSAVIHSKRRYTYQEAFTILQSPPAPGDPLAAMLHDMNSLAQTIRRRRFRAGSLDLDFPERKIRLDDQGKVVRIEKVENDISHQLIEEYMLLANEAVAKKLMGAGKPAIYRIHEQPKADRLEEFREEVLIHNVPCGDLRRREEVQKLLERLNRLPIGPALKIGFLKSLMRARYSIEPLGHYGLAKTHYTHFTSPIRRYADLVVHRALFHSVRMTKQQMHESAEHISLTERNSADAERDSKDVKLYAFLAAQLESGQPVQYRALVTDVRNFGFFVDVPELSMSGLVHLSTMDDDFYNLDSQTGALVGRRTRRVIRIGDNVTVQVEKVNKFKKEVDFRVATVSKQGRPSLPPPAPRHAHRPEPAPARPPHRPGPALTPVRQPAQPASTPWKPGYTQRNRAQKRAERLAPERPPQKPIDPRKPKGRGPKPSAPGGRPMLQSSLAARNRPGGKKRKKSPDNWEPEFSKGGVNARLPNRPARRGRG